MRIARNLVSVLLKTPKVQPKRLYYVNVRRSHDLVRRGQLRSQFQRETCRCEVITPPLTQIRYIRLTDPKRALHPILLLLLRPLSKFITVISGRLIRKWWNKLTPQEKKLIWNKIKGKKSLISAFGTVSLITFALYYYEHVVETPLTKRKRFIMISDDAMIKLSQYATSSELQNHKRDIVPPNHPFFQRAARVAGAIIQANRDIPECNRIPWSVIVIDRPDITNACALPNGVILVFTGILNVCTSDDQLAIVLSHEMSHTILSHATENFSKLYLVEALLIIPSLICWIVFTDIWALMSECLTRYLSDILIHLPFSRSLEREADMVGLFLAARACFDVREAPLFWSKMALIETSYSPVEWLSTHPTSETRKEDMGKIMPAALELRSSSNCPKLRNYPTRYWS